MESTSYQAKLAACGAVIDRLLAEHPDGPATRDITVNVGPYGPLGGQVNLHLSTFAAVVGWARLLNATPRGVYGRGDVIQTDFTVTVDNVAVHALGSTSCAFGDVAHEHETCLEQARAAASADLAGVTQECANCKTVQPAADMTETPIVPDPDRYDDDDWRWLCDDFEACQVRAGGVEPEDES